MYANQGPPPPQWNQQPPQQQQQQAPGYGSGYYGQPPHYAQHQPPQSQQYPHQQHQPPQNDTGIDLMNNAAAQVMMNPGAWQVMGNQAFSMGQQYVNQNVGRFIHVQSWKYYWNVSNHYVLSKLALLLFPFRHKTWTRMVVRSETSGQVEGFKPPRSDINAPDLYIPVMSFVTYILLVGVAMGMEDRFTPEVLTMTASTALFFTITQVLLLRLGIYLLNVSTSDPPLAMTDLVAYSGYQYVSLIFIQAVSLFVRTGWTHYAVLAYTCIALGWCQLRALRNIVMPSTDPQNNIANPTAASQRKHRVYFLMVFVLFQVFSVWWLVK